MGVRIDQPRESQQTLGINDLTGAQRIDIRFDQRKTTVQNGNISKLRPLPIGTDYAGIP